MQAKKTQIWLTLTWNEERLQSQRLDTPRQIWLGEAGDLVIPTEALGVPRVLLLTHADGTWLHPDGRAVALNHEVSRQFGDFLVQFVLAEREPAHLPAAWPRELAHLGLAMALAIGLVAMPLWLGGQTERLHIQVMLPEEELAAVVPVPRFVDAQQPPEPPREPQVVDDGERSFTFPPTIVDLPRPPKVPIEIVEAPPLTKPTPGKPSEPMPKPRQSPTRVGVEDPRDALAHVDQLGTPQTTRTKLWGDPQTGDPARSGTDVDHGAKIAGDPQRHDLPDAPILGDPRPRKIATNGDPDLNPGHQDVVQVKSPRAAVVEGNGLDAETVHTYIQRMHGQLRHCLELGMLGSDKLNGRVRVAFVIAPDGSVMQARVEESALRQPETEACIAERIRDWHFPAAPTGLPTRVRHGFVFKTK